MRNWGKYPITLDEMIAAVELAYEEEAVRARQPNYPIGGIHMTALHEAAIRLKRLQFAADVSAPPINTKELEGAGE